ncbi:MAG: DUF4340 domain-containing protein, partial [Candidatus Omnitrophota bacterium]
MKFRKLLIIAGVVFCLLLLAVVKNVTQKRQVSRRDREITVINLTKDLSEGFVSKIIVYKGSDEKNKMALRKDPAGKWVLENRFGLKARPEAIESLLKELTDVSGEIRADSKLVFEDFGISDASGVHVILKAANDKILNHIVLGLKRPAWNMNFVRLASEEKVIAAQKDILLRLNLYDANAKLDENYFADFKVLSLDINKVERFEVKEANKQALVLVKRSVDKGAPLVWNSEPTVNGQEINPSKVEGFLQNIANIYSQDALDPALKTYGFDRPSLEIKIFTPLEKQSSLTGFIAQDNLQPIQLDVGSYLEPQKAFFLRILPHGLVFRVPESFIQNLKKERS